MITIIYKKTTYSNSAKPNKQEKELLNKGWKLTSTSNESLFFKYRKEWEIEYGQIREKGDL